jgi:ComF family protein
VLERNIHADLAIPVPLNRRKERERGFNQSSQVAEGVSTVTGIPPVEHLILRNKNTISQTTLTKEMRQENVRNAFVVPPRRRKRIEGKSCLLIDDVITTGSTALECAFVLREAGASEVIACSIALAKRIQK